MRAHLGLSPIGLDAKEVDRLMPDELLRPLLDDLLVIQRPNHFDDALFKSLKTSSPGEKNILLVLAEWKQMNVRV